MEPQQPGDKFTFSKTHLSIFQDLGLSNSNLCSFINCRLMGTLLASVSLSLLGYMQGKTGKFLQVTPPVEETHQPSKAHFFGTTELEGTSLRRGKQSTMSLLPPCVPFHKTKIVQLSLPSLRWKNPF